MLVAVLLILVVLGSGLYFVWNKRRRAGLLKTIRTTWRQPRRPPANTELDRIRLYDRLKSYYADNGLDDKTWSDLNLDQIFEYIDRTSSRVGQQFLFYLLRNPQFQEEPLLKFEQIVNSFYDEKLRESVQVELHRLNHKDALFLPYLFLAELPQFRNRRFVFLSITLVTLALFVGAIFSKTFLVIALPLMFINMLTSFYYRRQLEAFIQPLRLLNVLIHTSRKIADICDDSKLVEETKKLKDEVKNLAGVQRKTALLSFDRQQDDLATLIYQYLNLALLLDVNCFAFAVEELRKKRGSVSALYEGLGYLDAAISVVSVRQGNPHFTTPDFLGRAKACSFKQLYHPLLSSPVANDLNVDVKGILLTGSNMSGKSTFIRTVGVNVVLAQTIHVCLAQKYQAPFLHVKASMGASDSLMESKSHYLSEVESIRGLVDSAQTGKQCLFLIDELFRGTNTIERVAAAKAILEYLNRGANIVMAATHDIELAELLDQQYECHHFREVIQNEQMDFDYKIQEGTSSTRNAIAILRMTGYPRAIVVEALNLVEELAQNGTRVRRG